MKLGSGVHGKVHSDSNELIAIKTFRSKGNEITESFILECSILRACNHPNIISMVGYSIDVDNDVYQLVMPRGNYDLLNIVNKGLPYDANYIVNGIAEGLYYLESKGIIHADLKVDNIVIFNNTPKIIDFGHTYFMDSSGQIQGEINCIKLSPIEAVISPWGKYNAKVHSWSLGMIWYYLLNKEELIKGRIHTANDLVRELVSKLETRHCYYPELDKWILRHRLVLDNDVKVSLSPELKGLLALNPEDRTSISEFLGRSRIVLALDLFPRTKPLDSMLKEGTNPSIYNTSYKILERLGLIEMDVDQKLLYAITQLAASVNNLQPFDRYRDKDIYVNSYDLLVLQKDVINKLNFRLI